MQFHLNGFRTGDPHILDAPEHERISGTEERLPDEIDVLIVGSGPTGLTLAAQLSAFRGLTTRVIEQRPGRLLVGQADGIACRTMEMFEAFGFAERVVKEAYWVNETAFWKPRPDAPQEIGRSGRIEDTEEGLSEFPHVILNQARIHDFFLDIMERSPSRLSPSYSRRLTEIAVDPDPHASHPVTATIERTDPGHEGERQTVRARYAVGCEGSRSQVRKALGRELSGDAANQAWGVMDVLAVTDFPDVRLKAVVHSANEGNLLIIPREGGYMIRLYIEMDKLNSDERVATRNITVDRLIAAASRILHPYSFEVKEVAWWSVYEIGQRLCDRFDDVADGEDRDPRVFIAGDACHTHSPKAGQGMNVSMQDAFNLGWKLASVILGRSARSLLRTYSAERQGVAKELIEFDREFAKMFSTRPKTSIEDGAAGLDPAEFQRYFVQHGRFTAGTATRYGSSIISAEPRHQHLAEGLTIGMRFHSAPVIRLADAKPMQLGHAVKADGRWRLFVFDAQSESHGASARLEALCVFLQSDTASPIRRHTPESGDSDSVIDLCAILQKEHRDVHIPALPALLQPRKGRYGLLDHEKVFCPVLKGEHDIFALRGIDRNAGCIVIIRPDQYVAAVLPIDAYQELSEFFLNCLLEA